MTPWNIARSEPPTPKTVRPLTKEDLLAFAVLWGAPSVVGFALFVAAVTLPLPFHLNVAIVGALAAGLAIAAVGSVVRPPRRSHFVVWEAVLSLSVESAVVYVFFRAAPEGLVPAAIGIVAIAVCVLRHKRVCSVLVVLYVFVLAACLLDWPATPDTIPYQLSTIVDARSLERFYAYPLAQYSDNQWLWRIDARPEVLASIATKSGMTPCANAPNAFWRMPPYYWPRTIPDGGRLYCTPSFPSGSRGPDGWHFIMAVDVTRSRAFVWFINNF